MELRTLGRTDIKVSALCLGTMTYGEQNTEAEGHAQMDYALEKGVNFFDTAELYAIPPKKETQGGRNASSAHGFKKPATGTRSCWRPRLSAGPAWIGSASTAKVPA
jgi:diketogulonate reductase-like aldo/keto reductase